MIRQPQALQSKRDIEQSVTAKPNFVRDYSALKANLDEVMRVLNNGEYSPIEGEGSPEGVTAANSSKMYVDTTNAPTSVSIYYNSVIGSKTGWIIQQV